MLTLCLPALIYLVFAAVHVLLDVFHGQYNTALSKAVVSALVAWLLNTLCVAGMGVLSWIIVFVPFVLLSALAALLLFALRLQPTSGTVAPGQQTVVLA